MTITINLMDVFWWAAMIAIAGLGFYVIFEMVVGYFYDHYCGDKSTKEYKERNK